PPAGRQESISAGRLRSTASTLGVGRNRPELDSAARFRPEAGTQTREDIGSFGNTGSHRNNQKMTNRRYTIGFGMLVLMSVAALGQGVQPPQVPAGPARMVESV